MCHLLSLFLRPSKMKRKPSFARLSPLAKGRIIGMREAGFKRGVIAKKVKKKDGRATTIRTVDTILQRFSEDPDWDGVEHREAGGRPRLLTLKQEAKILQVLLRDVGRQVVSASHVKRNLPELRRVSDRLVQRTFHRMGYAYRYRRRKAAVGEQYKPARLKYCD